MFGKIKKGFTRWILFPKSLKEYQKREEIKDQTKPQLESEGSRKENFFSSEKVAWNAQREDFI